MQLKALSIQAVACSLLLIASLEAAELKELQKKMDTLESENYRLRQEISMEEEASKLLGKKLLKEYEDKVVLENGLKDKDKKIEALEEELAGVRKLMENEIASHRKQIQRYESLKDKDMARIYLDAQEEEKKGLQKKLLQKEKEAEAALAEIDKLKKRLISGAEGVTQGKDKIAGHADNGKILSVSKEFNFIIIEFNNPDLAGPGKVFSVFRGESEIGKVEITKTRGKYVFAKLLDTIPGEELKEGDIVR